MAEMVGALTWRRGDYRTPLPISLLGLWSPRQAFRVMERMRDQAEAQGLMLVPIDVTTLSDPGTRLLVLVCCRHHDVVVERGKVCERCNQEWPR